MGANQALEAARALALTPSLAPAMREARLPAGVTALLRFLAGEIDASELTAGDATRLQDIVERYVFAVMLHPGAAPERILGVHAGASREEMRAHMRLLMIWLHPDRAGDAQRARARGVAQTLVGAGARGGESARHRAAAQEAAANARDQARMGGAAGLEAQEAARARDDRVRARGSRRRRQSAAPLGAEGGRRARSRDRQDGGMARPMSDNASGDSPSGGRAAPALLIAGGVFVLYLLTLTASDLLSRRPTVALLLNPYNSAALLARAEAALEQEPPDFQEARRHAEAALRADPLAPGVHRTLARVAEESEEDAKAPELVRLSARFARDGDAQFRALQQSLDDRDYAEATHRLDMLFRGQGRGRWPRLGQAFANLVADPPMAEALARKLGEDPPWRPAYVEQTFARAANVDALVDFYARLPRPLEEETRFFLERLVNEGRLGAAHALFLSQLAPERLPGAALLYNARFQYGVSNLPFDWVFTPMPNTLTELRRDRGRRVLRVTFFGGRTPYRNVNHFLALLPGDYVFSGLEQAQALNNPRGLRWRIACTNQPGEAVAATPLLTGDIPQRPFSVSFSVPEDCPFQLLQLELAFRVALETEATGSVSYSDLALTVAPARQ